MSALDSGVCNPGLHFGTRRHLQLRQIATLAKNFKQQSEEQRIAAIDDPWKFKQAAWIENEPQTYVQTSAILHLVFPDTFERILPKYHKERIVGAFSNRIDKGSDDLDRNILLIRDRLSETYGEYLDFYDESIWPQWDPEHSPDTSKWGDSFSGLGASSSIGTSTSKSATTSSRLQTIFRWRDQRWSRFG